MLVTHTRKQLGTSARKYGVATIMARDAKRKHQHSIVAMITIAGNPIGLTSRSSGVANINTKLVSQRRLHSPLTATSITTIGRQDGLTLKRSGVVLKKARDAKRNARSIWKTQVAAGLLGTLALASPKLACSNGLRTRRKTHRKGTNVVV
jgi:hypothetical protein